MGHLKSAKPRPQLKPLLKHFPIFLVGRIFNGDGVVTFDDFTAFFCLALALVWNIYKSRGGAGLETNFVMLSCSKRLG
jgi:hypothetical protein